MAGIPTGGPTQAQRLVPTIAAPPTSGAAAQAAAGPAIARDRMVMSGESNVQRAMERELARVDRALAAGHLDARTGTKLQLAHDYLTAKLANLAEPLDPRVQAALMQLGEVTKRAQHADSQTELAHLSLTSKILVTNVDYVQDATPEQAKLLRQLNGIGERALGTDNQLDLARAQMAVGVLTRRLDATEYPLRPRQQALLDQMGGLATRATTTTSQLDFAKLQLSYDVTEAQLNASSTPLNRAQKQALANCQKLAEQAQQTTDQRTFVQLQLQYDEQRSLLP